MSDTGVPIPRRGRSLWMPSIRKMLLLSTIVLIQSLPAVCSIIVYESLYPSAQCIEPISCSSDRFWFSARAVSSKTSSVSLSVSSRVRKKHLQSRAIDVSKRKVVGHQVFEKYSFMHVCVESSMGHCCSAGARVGFPVELTGEELVSSKKESIAGVAVFNEMRM